MRRRRQQNTHDALQPSCFACLSSPPSSRSSWLRRPSSTRPAAAPRVRVTHCVLSSRRPRAAPRPCVRAACALSSPLISLFFSLLFFKTCFSSLSRFFLCFVRCPQLTALQPPSPSAPSSPSLCPMSTSASTVSAFCPLLPCRSHAACRPSRGLGLVQHQRCQLPHHEPQPAHSSVLVSCARSC